MSRTYVPGTHMSATTVVLLVQHYHTIVALHTGGMGAGGSYTTGLHNPIYGLDVLKARDGRRQTRTPPPPIRGLRKARGITGTPESETPERCGRLRKVGGGDLDGGDPSIHIYCNPHNLIGGLSPSLLLRHRNRPAIEFRRPRPTATTEIKIQTRCTLVTPFFSSSDGTQ